MSTTPPDSPPAAPVIPQGLATKLGQAGTLILGLASTLTAILPGDHSGQTKLFATLATVVAVATILGRMLQAAAALVGGQTTTVAAVPGPDPVPADLDGVKPDNSAKAAKSDVGDGKAAR